MAVTNPDGSVTLTADEWQRIRNQLLELDRRDPDNYRRMLEVGIACAYRMLFQPETYSPVELEEELHEFRAMVAEPLAVKLRACQDSGLFR